MGYATSACTVDSFANSLYLLQLKRKSKLI